jgi:hypothetical protein
VRRAVKWLKGRGSECQRGTGTCGGVEALEERGREDAAMPLIETIKEKVEKITGIGRPTRRDVDTALRPCKPTVLTDFGIEKLCIIVSVLLNRGIQV